MLSALAFIVLFVTGLIVAGSILYLLFLLMAAERANDAIARRDAEPKTEAETRFVVVIPAHNEELVLGGTLRSFSSQEYPKSLFEVIVVADNCTDRTADVARAFQSTVMERVNHEERGKGYALDWAFQKLLKRSAPADAFVIVDADTWVAPNFLLAMSARLSHQTDKNGYCALQGRYGVLNPSDGWRAALMAGAFDLFNHVKPLGRDYLGFSVGLKGNGMVFTRALMTQARWSGASVTEDIDYGLDLARNLSVRVGYVPEAQVLAQMPATAEQAASQRDRWEGGRLELLRDRALPLLVEGLQTHNPLLIDSAIDLLVPPLAELALLLGLWAVLVLGAYALHILIMPYAWALAVTFSAFGLAVYILAGFRVSDAPPEAYHALLRAPFYAVWKVGLAVMRAGRRRKSSEPTEWVRTARAPLAGSEADPTAASKTETTVP